MRESWVGGTAEPGPAPGAEPVALLLPPSETAVEATAITRAPLSKVVGQNDAVRAAAPGRRTAAGWAKARVRLTISAAEARGRARESDALCEEINARRATGQSSARPG